MPFFRFMLRCQATHLIVPRSGCEASATAGLISAFNENFVPQKQKQMGNTTERCQMWHSENFHATNQTFAEAETEKKTFKLLELVDFETNEHAKIPRHMSKQVCFGCL